MSTRTSPLVVVAATRVVVKVVPKTSIIRLGSLEFI